MQSFQLIILGIVISSIIIGIYLVWKYRLHRAVKESFQGSSKVAVAVLMRKPIDIFLWLKHHRDLGISHFFLRIEDTPGLDEFLKTQPDITYEMKESSKENNYETLQVRQIEFVNQSMQKAKRMGIQWMFHIDADELLEGSLSFLDKLEEKYKCVKIENVEALYEEGQESCFSAKRFLKCSDKGVQCRSYVNGKGGGRIVDGVALGGPHDFTYNGKIGDETYKVPFDKLHVLHFDSCTFGSWSEKFQHLSKGAKDVPFAYYNDSMDAAVKAYEIYKKYTMLKDVDPSQVYTR